MANNVFDFGAVGDGSTDDTIAIQNAINDGQANRQPVFLPPGEFRITKTLQVKSDIDIFGEDANLCTLKHDLHGYTASKRRANAVCIRVVNTPEGEKTVVTPYVTLRRFRITTTEPRLNLGRTVRQTGLFVHDGFWNCIIREVIVQDFFQGIFLRQCWTAHLQNCSVERSLLHCLKWENATAGEITGCRFDCISGETVTGAGNASVFVTFSHVDKFEETLALSVTNNAFQQSERAGFYGRGIGNLTMINNFFEGNNRSNNPKTAALHLDNDRGNTSVQHQQRVANIIGGFWTPGSNGRGTAINIGDYDVINIMGVDIRGSGFDKSIVLTGSNSQVNIIGVHATRPISIRARNPNIQNSILGD